MYNATLLIDLFNYINTLEGFKDSIIAFNEKDDIILMTICSIIYENYVFKICFDLGCHPIVSAKFILDLSKRFSNIEIYEPQYLLENGEIIFKEDAYKRYYEDLKNKIENYKKSKEYIKDQLSICMYP